MAGKLLGGFGELWVDRSTIQAAGPRLFLVAVAAETV